MPLRTGLLYTGAGARPVPSAGEVVPQGRVRLAGVTGYFDEVAGTGPVLPGSAAPAAALDGPRLAFLTGLGTRIVHLVADGAPDAAPDAAVDVDGVYLPLLRAARARYLLVRPDHHVYGPARTARELAALVDAFRSALTGRPVTAGRADPAAV
ncbi:3-(3-hydroxyphenyl)propionate hydroxylase OS=Streptomyces fumanus OX=67302 GN=mhpA PE=4 SV=1 [Streptomyces fumanus]